MRQGSYYTYKGYRIDYHVTNNGTAYWEEHNNEALVMLKASPKDTLYFSSFQSAIAYLEGI